jgi:hypothetical protein
VNDRVVAIEEYSRFHGESLPRGVTSNHTWAWMDMEFRRTEVRRPVDSSFLT